jgi:hypothetical protein
MIVELLTKEDLENLKKELLNEIRTALPRPAEKTGQWLKSADVRKMLNISPNTLQRLWINGELKFSKVGSSFYYKVGDVNKMLEESRK